MNVSGPGRVQRRRSKPCALGGRIAAGDPEAGIAGQELEGVRDLAARDQVPDRVRRRRCVIDGFEPPRCMP